MVFNGAEKLSPKELEAVSGWRAPATNGETTTPHLRPIDGGKKMLDRDSGATADFFGNNKMDNHTNRSDFAADNADDISFNQPSAARRLSGWLADRLSPARRQAARDARQMESLRQQIADMDADEAEEAAASVEYQPTEKHTDNQVDEARENEDIRRQIADMKAAETADKATPGYAYRQREKEVATAIARRKSEEAFEDADAAIRAARYDARAQQVNEAITRRKAEETEESGTKAEPLSTRIWEKVSGALSFGSKPKEQTLELNKSALQFRLEGLLAQLKKDFGITMLPDGSVPGYFNMRRYKNFREQTVPGNTTQSGQVFDTLTTQIATAIKDIALENTPKGGSARPVYGGDTRGGATRSQDIAATGKTTGGIGISR